MRGSLTVSVRRYPPRVNKRSQCLLQKIEDDALDQKTPVGDLLRMVIILGGQADSAKMRDWARRELEGYGPDDELPPYRIIAAPLRMDWGSVRVVLRGETISPWELPDFARDKMTDEVHLRFGIAEIEQMARRTEPSKLVELPPPGAADLVALINARDHRNRHLERLYWGVSPVALAGVVDQVRTTLTAMTAEIRAIMPEGMEVPSPEVANNAHHVVVEGGKRHTINVTAPPGGSTVATAAAESRQWVRIAAGVLLGLLTIAGVVFALMQAQGWRFG
jgi:hypothetical protein